MHTTAAPQIHQDEIAWTLDTPTPTPAPRTLPAIMVRAAHDLSDAELREAAEWAATQIVADQGSSQADLAAASLLLELAARARTYTEEGGF